MAKMTEKYYTKVAVKNCLLLMQEMWQLLVNVKNLILFFL